MSLYYYQQIIKKDIQLFIIDKSRLLTEEAIEQFIHYFDKFY